MKNYYTAYVQHMIAFYNKTRGIRPKSFYSNVDKMNWEAVDTAIRNESKALSQTEITIAMAISKSYGWVKDKIDAYSNANNIPQDAIWSAVRAFEKRIAQLRGLVAEDER